MKKKKSIKMKERCYMHKITCLKEEFRDKTRSIECHETEEYEKEMRSIYESEYKERIEEIEKQMKNL